MTTLVSPWNTVPPHVIVNCFSKAGISDSIQQVALTDEDDPFKELNPENVSTECFSAVNDHLIVTTLAATNSEILSQILSDNDDSDDEIVEDKLPVCPSKRDTENALETLQNASSSEMQNLVLQLEKLMSTERKSNSHQKLVKNYFKKCSCL